MANYQHRAHESLCWEIDFDIACEFQLRICVIGMVGAASESVKGCNMRKAFGFLLALAALCFAPAPALAYIDPNTGGLLFQILAPLTAIVASAWLLAKEKFAALLTKLVGLVRRRKP